MPTKTLFCSRRLFAALMLALLLSPALAIADSLSFTGTLPDGPDGQAANGVVVIPFTLSSDSDIEMQTFAYGGGMNAAGNAIAGVGFLPVLELYDGAGNLLLDSVLSGTPGCGPAGVDTFGFCGDVRLSFFDFYGMDATAGDYQLAVLAFGNAPMGFTLAEGFSNTGSLDGIDGARDASYAVDITATGLPGVTPVPEPASLWIALTGLLAAAWVKYRFGNANARALKF